jgi:hypothetical protein
VNVNTEAKMNMREDILAKDMNVELGREKSREKSREGGIKTFCQRHVVRTEGLDWQ